jgi:hypothetical protein
MVATFILMFHLSTPSAGGGMTLMSAEFSTQARCEAAGRAAEKKFGGMMSRPYWLCVEK